MTVGAENPDGRDPAIPNRHRVCFSLFSPILARTLFSPSPSSVFLLSLTYSYLFNHIIISFIMEYEPQTRE